MKRLMIVEDEEDTRMILTASLGNNKFDITEAVNGKEALFKALQCVPDAVLMDIQMPILNGLDALKLFKTLKPLRRVPVIMLTGLRRKMDVLSSMQMGAADYVTKPCRIDSLLPRLVSVLSLPPYKHTPLFHYLDYNLTSDGEILILSVKSDLTQDSIEDLHLLVEAMMPMQPFKLELDFEGVGDIDVIVHNTASDIKEMITASGGAVHVTNFHKDRYRNTAAGLLLNIFPAQDEKPDIKKPENKVKSSTGWGQASSKRKIPDTSNRGDLRYNYMIKGEVLVINLSGDLTSDTMPTLKIAFSSVADNRANIAVDINNIRKLDTDGMEELVSHLSYIRYKPHIENLAVICKSVKRRQAFLSARGQQVAGIYDQYSSAMQYMKSKN